MPDDEHADYGAYLKKKTYDDLVSISESVDKETQAWRYEMVLAEIAERDKRGEKSGEKTDSKPAANFVAIVLGFVFVISGIVGVLTGTVYTKHGHEIIATEKPVAFRIFVGLYLVLGAFLLFSGFKNLNNKK